MECERLNEITPQKRTGIGTDKEASRLICDSSPRALNNAGQTKGTLRHRWIAVRLAARTLAT